MTTQLKLYNTLTRSKVDFEPLDPTNVRMYVCGPTVYDFAHIGNARPVIVFDVLFRLLRHIYGAEHVTYARNITDVDDKINARAVRDFPGMPLNDAIRQVTSGTEAQFMADARALGCLDPTTQPRATEHIGDMVDIIGRLLRNGHAYIAHGAEGLEVLFSVATMKNYGALSNRNLADQREGARVAVEPHKKNAADFVLWKESSQNEPGWPAEFPPDADYRANSDTVTIFGRPGWHIECSAMSMAKLLEPFGGGLTCDDPVKNTFDIHGGGLDLIFPHHENEIAQSCCAFGTAGMASVWMHNGFLQVEGQKMSKSLGNFVTIRELLNTTKFGVRTWPGEVLRLAMLKTHYRQPIDWTVKALEEAKQELSDWRRLLRLTVPSDAPSDELIDALSNDLNTHLAITVVRQRVGRCISGDYQQRVVERAQLAGDLRFLGFEDFIVEVTSGAAENRQALTDAIDVAFVRVKITSRNAARAAKNFAESDRLRVELEAMGVQLKDGKDEAGNPVTTWEVRR